MCVPVAVHPMHGFHPIKERKYFIHTERTAVRTKHMHINININTQHALNTPLTVASGLWEEYGYVRFVQMVRKREVLVALNKKDD